MQQDEFEKQRRVKAVAKLSQKMPTQKIVNLNKSFSGKEKQGLHSKSVEREVTRVSMELFDLAGKPSDSVGSKDSKKEDLEMDDAKSVSSTASREVLKSMENNKDHPSGESDKLSSIFTPPVAGSPKPRTPEEASLPSLPPTPQIFPTSKVDPLSNLKVKRKPDTVLVWVGPKKTQEPKYREQVFVMTREGKAAVPNKNFTDEILPASFEGDSKLNLGGSFNREISKSEFTHRSKQNTTREVLSKINCSQVSKCVFKKRQARKRLSFYKCEFFLWIRIVSQKVKKSYKNLIIYTRVQGFDIAIFFIIR